MTETRDRLAQDLTLTISARPNGMGVPYAKAEEIAGVIADYLADAIRDLQPKIELTEDHELCETQISELVEELRHLKDSPAWTQLSHSMKDRVTRAIRTRGVRLP